MRVGILKEIKTKEHRVSMTPSGVEQMLAHGHEVLVETGAGDGSVFYNKDYIKAGATICNSPEEIYEKCDMIMKVKEPLPVEYPLIRKGQVLFTYFHFAASLELTRAMIDSGSISIAYETVELQNGSLPLLTPMSEVAGKMAIQEGAKYLEKTYGAKIACGLGAKVYLLDTNLERLRYLSDIMPPNCFLLMSSPATLRRLLKEADLVVGAVLITGAVAPKLISRDMLKLMKKGSVIVDVSIDQGGCVETAKPTTHDDPIYEVDGVIHYCVANMPGAVSYTSAKALTNATLPYALEIADKGYINAAKENPEIAKGINVFKGKVTHKGVAEAFDMEYEPLDSLL
jgi:alanine dehydrogenase